jgi:alanine racemase
MSPPHHISGPEVLPASLDLCPRQRAWVEIDRGAIITNTRRVRASLAAETSLMAVVKADGYGHGAVTVAEAAREGGAGSFGVATLAEAIELRQAGLTEPVLVLGNLTQPSELRSCLHWGLMPTLSGLTQALVASNVGIAGGRDLDVHLKLDTGMTRLGAAWEEGPALLNALADLEGVRLRGVYSHLADADSPDDSITRLQLERFSTVLTRLAELELRPGLRHLANSAATLGGDRTLQLDMVRVGLALYGHAPAAHLRERLPLRPAMSVRARVTMVRTVPAGVGVSYGHSFVTRRPSRLAVVGIGYADGVVRSLSNRLQVLAHGQRLPQVGKITMDQLVIDATDCPELTAGDVVTLLGEAAGGSIEACEWADLADTIPWEILCGFRQRLPRLPVGHEAEVISS